MSISRKRDVGTVVGGVALLGVVAVSPQLRSALVPLDPLLGPALFLAAFGAAVLHRAARRFGGAAALVAVLRAEGATKRFLARHGWALAIVAFLLPLFAHWAAQPPSSLTAHAALLGYVPWGDAIGHYEGGARLLERGEFLTYSARRPFHACWLAVRLALTGGDVPGALLLQAIVLGYGAHLLARSVGIRLGLAPALAVFGFTYAFVREYSPAVLTEPIGIGLACVALSIFFTRASRKEPLAMGLAFLALDAALRARPGPQFLFATLGLWAIYVFKGRRVRTAAIVVGVFVFGSVYTSVLNRFYSSHETTFTSQLGHTIYGLASGSNYLRAEEDMREAGPMPETERASVLFQKAWDKIREDPAPFRRALLHNGAKFVTKAPANLNRLVSPRALVVPASGRVSFSWAEASWDRRLGGTLLILAALGFLSYLRHANAAGERLFWFASSAGVLASAPIVYGDAGFRSMAAAYPFIALLFALGCAPRPWRTLTRAGASAERGVVRRGAVVTASLLAMALVGPVLARALVGRGPAASSETPAIAVAVIEPHRSPLVVVRNPLEPDTFGALPLVDRPDFLRLVGLADLKGELEPLTQRRPPFVLLSALDRASGRVRTLVGPVEIARSPARFVRVELVPWKGSDTIEDVLTWTPIP